MDACLARSHLLIGQVEGHILEVSESIGEGSEKFAVSCALPPHLCPEHKGSFPARIEPCSSMNLGCLSLYVTILNSDLVGREDRDRGRSYEADRSEPRTSRYSERGPPASHGCVPPPYTPISTRYTFAHVLNLVSLGSQQSSAYIEQRYANDGHVVESSRQDCDIINGC